MGDLPFSDTIYKPPNLYVSGKVALDALKKSLSGYGANLTHVVKVTVFVTDMSSYSAVNEIYAKYFAPPYPVRTFVGVAALPLNCEIEVDAIAYLPAVDVKKKD